MSMSLRLAAAGEQVGLTEPHILGFAAALSSGHSGGNGRIGLLQSVDQYLHSCGQGGRWHERLSLGIGQVTSGLGESEACSRPSMCPASWISLRASRNGQLPTKAVERMEEMGVVEQALIFSVTAFDFSVMARSVRLNPFVPNMKLCGFKKSEDIPFAVGKPIRKFKAVIRSDAFDLYPFAGNLLVGLGRSLFLGYGWFD